MTAILTVLLTSLAGAVVFVFAMRWAERAPNWPTQLGWVVVALFLPVVYVVVRLAARPDYLVVVVR